MQTYQIVSRDRRVEIIARIDEIREYLGGFLEFRYRQYGSHFASRPETAAFERVADTAHEEWCRLRTEYDPDEDPTTRR